MRRRLTMIALILLVLTLIAGSFVSRSDEAWMDAISGSVKSQYTWNFGITTHRKMETSALEQRLHAMGYEWTPRWCCVRCDIKSLWGHEIDDSTVPAIYQIHSFLADYVCERSDRELRTFAEILRTAIDEQQKAALDEACEQILRTMSEPGS